MVDWKNITRIVNIPEGAIVKFYDEEQCMKVVKAVSECDPWQENDVSIERYCLFCDEPEHTEDCPYILAKRIMEDE